MSVNTIPIDRFSRDSHVVFFTGAGISAESGISTFRDPDGHWSKYDPMKLASQAGFQEDPELVLNWYADRRETICQAQPNAAHTSISNFQKLFRHSVVITQNVDGLHERAGNRSIYELHGNIHRHKCNSCAKIIDLTEKNMRTLNTCDCGGKIRPDVVWFGESLPLETINAAFEAAQSCDLMFSIGTSAQIYPAAQLPIEAQSRGAYVVEINPEPTPFSPQADMSVRDDAGSALPKFYEDFHAQFK
ncbi:MAG: NAD-dependent deacylase [Candidatus Marinimicrobia bacterium]|nr:NAD-dependent deacylase [Candidatus Neomarinimicrobiota bacterium]